ncbi:histidine phosphatase family protein [Paenibacillus sp. TRM 82003]|nr:histidine phosphatase family protein [Paenibacillus sp. TRM 82003]
MKTYLYMVRHAESPYVFGEERSRGLSESGFQAARRVAEVLDSEEIHSVVSSPYVRAKQTVQFLAERKSLPIVAYEELRERPMKGLHFEASWDELQTAIERSFRDPDYALEGGESTKQAQQRAIPIILDLIERYEGKSVAIGTHGNIMTIVMNYFDPVYGFEFWSRTSMPDIYRMTFENGRYVKTDRIWGKEVI